MLRAHPQRNLQISETLSDASVNVVLRLDRAPSQCQTETEDYYNSASFAEGSGGNRFDTVKVVVGRPSEPLKAVLNNGLHWKPGSFLLEVFFTVPATGSYPVTVYCAGKRVASTVVRVDSVRNPKSNADIPQPATRANGGGMGLGIVQGPSTRTWVLGASYLPRQCVSPQVTLGSRSLTLEDPASGRMYANLPFWQVAVNVHLPEDTPVGLHMLSLRCSGTAGLPDPLVASPVAVYRPWLSGEGDKAGGGASASTDRRSPVFTAIPKPSDVPWGLRSVLTTLAVASALLFLIGFPADIVNKTIEENREEINGWFRGWEPRLASLRTRIGGLSIYGFSVADLWATPWRRLTWFTVIAALLTTFVDPTAGFDIKTLLLFAGLGVAFPLTTMAYTASQESFARRFSGTPAVLNVLPLGLCLAGFCALFSYVAGFVPGYVFGLIAGYMTAREVERSLSTEDAGRSALVASGTLLAVALLAWVALERTHSASALPLLAVDAVLCAVFILGVQTLVFGLIPLRYLDGHKLWSWNRGAWIAVYGPAMFCFIHVMVLNRERVLADGSAPALVPTLALFIGFGALSMAFWAYFRYRPARPEPAPTTTRTGDQGGDGTP